MCKFVVNFPELVINPPTATNFDGEVSSGSESLQVFFYNHIYERAEKKMWKYQATYLGNAGGL